MEAIQKPKKTEQQEETIFKLAEKQITKNEFALQDAKPEKPKRPYSSKKPEPAKQELQPATSLREIRKDPLPQNRGQLKPREDKNFLKDNQKDLKPPKAPVQEQPAQKPKSYGKVPAYLQAQNKAREEQAQKLASQEEQAKNCPPGTKLMPEAERVQTLADL